MAEQKEGLAVELAAIETIHDALKPLSKDSRDRALKYVKERLASDEQPEKPARRVGQGTQSLPKQDPPVREVSTAQSKGPSSPFEAPVSGAPTPLG